MDAPTVSLDILGEETVSVWIFSATEGAEYWTEYCFERVTPKYVFATDERSVEGRAAAVASGRKPLRLLRASLEKGKPPEGVHFSRPSLQSPWFERRPGLWMQTDYPVGRGLAASEEVPS